MMSSQIRIAPYMLVVPPRPLLAKPLSPSPSSIESEQIRYDDDRNQQKKKRSSFWGTNCGCLSTILGGIGLATLLIVSIVVPLVIALTNTDTGTSSTTTTTTTTGTTSTASTTTDTSTTTDVPCLQTCASYQVCAHGKCVGTGYLSCTLTWSRNGDGDIVVKTPNNNTISYINPNSSSATDYGRLDVDDTSGTGPENIFWSNSTTAPPSGTYYVCFSQFAFNPNSTTQYPITATVKIVRSTNTDITLTKTFVSPYRNGLSCGSTFPHLVGSFSYP